MCHDKERLALPSASPLLFFLLPFSLASPHAVTQKAFLVHPLSATSLIRIVWGHWEGRSRTSQELAAGNVLPGSVKSHCALWFLSSESWKGAEGQNLPVSSRYSGVVAFQRCMQESSCSARQDPWRRQLEGFLWTAFHSKHLSLLSSSGWSRGVLGVFYKFVRIAPIFCEGGN